MANNQIFIEVEKVILNTIESKISIVSDVVRVSDIKSFRKWNKTDAEKESVTGEMTQVSISSKTAADGFYNIRISESKESFAKRLGGFIIGL